ncbi:MAG: hypothetical protein IKJ80_00555 [Clostridia bacterium]|nr:hypothetical protein [Clostridia bacterium]
MGVRDRYLERQKKQEEEKKSYSVVLDRAESLRPDPLASTRLELNRKGAELGIPSSQRVSVEKKDGADATMSRVRARYLMRQGKGVSDEVSERLKAWTDNTNAYRKAYNDRVKGKTGTYSDAYDGTTQEWLSDLSARREALDTEAKAIMELIAPYKDMFGPDAYKAMENSFVDSYKVNKEIGSAADNYNKYWSQWADEAQYEEWANSQRERAEYLSADLEALRREIEGLEKQITLSPKEELKAQLEEKRKYYAKASHLQTVARLEDEATSAADFEHYAAMGEAIDNSAGGKGTITRVANPVTYARDHAEDVASAEAQGYAWGSSSLYSQMTKEEVKIYNYYHAKYGEQRGMLYISAIEDELVERQKAETLVARAEWGQQHPIATLVMSPVMSLVAAGETVVDGAAYLVGADDELDDNWAARVNAAMRQGGASGFAYSDPEGISGGVGVRKPILEIGGWNAGEFLYNTAASMGESLAIGSIPYAGPALLGMSAAASGVNDALDRGMSDGQAFMTGVMSGVFEGLFEKLSIGRFNALKEVPPATIKDIAKNVVNSMGVNFAEEFTTELANIVYDTIMNGEFAHYTREDLASGKWKDAVLQMVEAGASGALMGAGFGGIASASGYSSAKNTGATLIEKYGYTPKDVVAEALAIDSKDPLATRLKIKLDSGGKVSYAELGELVRRIEVHKAESGDAYGKSTVGNTAAERTGVGKLSRVGGEGAVADVAERSVGEGSAEGALDAAEYRSMLDAVRRPAGTADTFAANARVSPESVAAAKAQAEQTVSAQKTQDTQSAAAQKAQGVKSPVTADAADGATVKDVKTASIENSHLQKAAEDAEYADEGGGALTLKSASRRYGAQAGAMIHTYIEGQDVESYAGAYGLAYDMGRSGVSLDYTMSSEGTSYLTENQRTLAWEAGRAAADEAAQRRDGEIKRSTSDKKGRRRGTVRSEGVSLAELKKTFNDRQGVAYKTLSVLAEATGVDIVLYKSDTDARGDFQGAQGKFKWGEDAIYIDVNAGLSNVKDVEDLAKYSMLRTFSHEFTHFIEKWNPIWYNEFRRVVFDTLAERGEDVDSLIAEKQSERGGMDYEKASREVVAEAMTDVLPDANFVTELANNHKGIFNKMLERLKQFLADVKAYFATLVRNPSREANALKENVDGVERYLESIVTLFDRVALEAVENYRSSTATKDEFNNYADGGAYYAEQRKQTERPETLHPGRETSAEKALGGTRESNENGPRVQEAGRGSREETQKVHHTHRGERRALVDSTGVKDKNNHIIPSQGDKTYIAKKTLEEEYGIECHVVKKEAWRRDAPAAIYEGEVYVSESIDEDTLLTLVPHEATHAMKQLGFRPYIDFIINTPDNLNLDGVDAKILLQDVAKHKKLDLLDIDEKQYLDLYDELNCFVYGVFKAGFIDDADYDYGWIPDAFNDFKAYIHNLSDLHEQFKKVNAKKTVQSSSSHEQAPSETRVDSESEQDQERKQAISDRELLSSSASELLSSKGGLTDAERDALDIFNKRLGTLEALEKQRAEQSAIWHKNQFGVGGDRLAASKARARMDTLGEQVKKAEEALLSIENKAVLGQVLRQARKLAEDKARQHAMEITKRRDDKLKNSAEIRKYRERVKRDVGELSKWLIKPDNKNVVKHIPEPLKNSVRDFLASIDFTSARSLRGGAATEADVAFIKRLKALERVTGSTNGVDELYDGYADLPASFADNLKKITDAANELMREKPGECVINNMSSEELKALSAVTANLKAFITAYNTFHYAGVFKMISQAADNTIADLSRMRDDGGKTGDGSDFLHWKQMRPAYVFERFGNGGRAVFDGLKRGQDQLAFNSDKILKFAEETYTAKEVKEWANEIKTIELTGGRTVKMPVTMAMSFYELAKRPQALGHILGEGVRPAVFSVGREKHSQEIQRYNELDVAAVINSLSDRQKEVADKQQSFMQEVGGEWGNYVSVRRFGEKQFGDPHYFPMNSDGTAFKVTADEKMPNANLYALLNMGFTKQVQEGAKNTLVLYDIFDVFANHMASMAQYNALALPVVDALKWLNFQQRTEPDAEGRTEVADSVRRQLRRAYGAKVEKDGKQSAGYAESFIVGVIRALNGTETQGGKYDKFATSGLRRVNAAQVAYNLRVVVQQPLAITRAGLLLDVGSILKGLKLSPAKVRQNVEEMHKYSGIAVWKSLGFYDVDISRGLVSLIKGDEEVTDKILDKGMWLAEKADLTTWSAIWSASKAQVEREQGLTASDEGYFDAVTKLFEEVIYKTQVVDGVLTKSEFMRDQSAVVRILSPFMSEPATNASMLLDAYYQFRMDVRSGMSRREAWKKNEKTIMRTVAVYATGAVLLAAVTAAMDALRDDDEYEEFGEKWKDAFWGNLIDELSPFNKLPVVNAIEDLVVFAVSAVKGEKAYNVAPPAVWMQGFEFIEKAVRVWTDEKGKYTDYGKVYETLRAASALTGLPLATLTREVVTIWNNVIGPMAPSLRLKTYDPGDLNEIKYAYMDGYLTREEAEAKLIENGHAADVNEAYFLITGWDDADGAYSRFDAVLDAVRQGGDFDAAMEELTSHGYAEKEVRSKVRSEVGAWYRDGDITKAQAKTMLEAYSGLDADDITSYLNRWSCVVVTGIEYEDIGKKLKAGDITPSRAAEMFELYGGMTKDAAKKKVEALEFEKAHPECEGISYAAVEAYRKHCESAGVDAGLYFEARQFYNSATSDKDENGEVVKGREKKDKVFEYIDSLELTRKQKDAVYCALGYSPDNLYKTPWH